MPDNTIKLHVEMVFDFGCWCIDAHKVYKAFMCRKAINENLYGTGSGINQLLSPARKKM